MKNRIPFKPIVGALLLLSAGAALADPPSRVARLAYVGGPVSFAPAGDDNWSNASLNRPLVPGDRVWTEPGARDEIQLGNAALRMGNSTLVTLLSMDDRNAQLQLSQGRLNLHVRRLRPGESMEIDTPNLALAIRAPGDYRIDVDPQGGTTAVLVRRGQADVYGDGNAYRLDDAQGYRFAGTDLRSAEPLAQVYDDDLDRWAAERDRHHEHARSVRYVSPELIGADDLDDQGDWRSDPQYGNVWVPTHVSRDWAPYRDGHWSWIDPWGWTWVDDAPWGFAVSHYGRWAHSRDQWCWVPAAPRAQPVYAPALVAFIAAGFAPQYERERPVAWFPLAPREAYRPTYRASPTYITNVNVNNTTINRTVINQIINVNNVTNINYANRRFPGAVTAVPANAFAQSQPVARSVLPIAGAALAAAAIAHSAPPAPMRTGAPAGLARGHLPPAAALAQHVLAKTPPAFAHPPMRVVGAPPASAHPTMDSLAHQVTVLPPARLARPIGHPVASAIPPARAMQGLMPGAHPAPPAPLAGAQPGLHPAPTVAQMLAGRAQPQARGMPRQPMPQAVRPGNDAFARHEAGRNGPMPAPGQNRALPMAQAVPAQMQPPVPRQGPAFAQQAPQMAAMPHAVPGPHQQSAMPMPPHPIPSQQQQQQQALLAHSGPAPHQQLPMPQLARAPQQQGPMRHGEGTPHQQVPMPQLTHAPQQQGPMRHGEATPYQQVPMPHPDPASHQQAMMPAHAASAPHPSAPMLAAAPTRYQQVPMSGPAHEQHQPPPMQHPAPVPHIPPPMPRQAPAPHQPPPMQHQAPAPHQPPPVQHQAPAPHQPPPMQHSAPVPHQPPPMPHPAPAPHQPPALPRPAPAPHPAPQAAPQHAPPPHQGGHGNDGKHDEKH